MDDRNNSLFNITGFYEFDIKLNVWKCSQNGDGVFAGSQKLDNTISNGSLYTMSRDLLGEQLTEVFQFLFTPVLQSSNTITESIEQNCDLKTDLKLNFRILYSWIIVAAILMLALITIFIILYTCMRSYKNKALTKISIYEVHFNEENYINNASQKELREQTICNQVPKHNKESSSVIKTANTNYSVRRSLKNYSPPHDDVDWFLKNSVDYFFSEMDKFLIHKAPVNTGGAPPPGSIADQVTSPRMTARRFGRRLRPTSTPSVPSLENGDEPVERKAWQKFQTKIVAMGRLPYFNDIESDMLQIFSPNTQKLTNFYFYHCPPPFEQWNASCLIVNYSLFLLDNILRKISDESGIHFHEFKMTGSMFKGLKVCNVNQFDVHMIFRGTSFDVDEVWHQQSSDAIPPGRVLLRTKSIADRRSWSSASDATHSGHGNRSSKLLKHCSLSDQRLQCVSSDELAKQAEALVDRAIQKLYTETRSLIDRLPFKIQRSASASLVLSLDTRNVIGLNLAEIKVQLVPSVYMPLKGWFNVVDIYAVPPWHCQDIKRKPSSPLGGILSQNLTISIDLLWSLSLGELEEKFLRSMEKKMCYSGTYSCHKSLICILKFLFTSISRKSLLDKGEVSSVVVETVVYYLLLESPPQQWTFDKLGDRFSDSIHFLKTALRHGRLPNFFVNNPHLMKQMPELSLYPMLTNGRQENIITDVRSELLEKNLKYIDCRLSETGLQCCVNEEYSEDMWEYEFFVF